MQDFSFVDETLDINLTQSYYLSIQAGLDGLSFCILDPVREKYIALAHKTFHKELIFDDFLNELENYLENNELLNHPYKSTRLIWVSPKNTLIPSSYFKKENLKQYFEFNQKLGELDEIHYNELMYIDAYSVFIVSNQVANIFAKKFQNISFYNQQIPFIEQSLLKHHSESKKVVANVNHNFMDLCITENGKLMHHNNFAFKTGMDIIYFILYVFEQFGLDPKTTELYLNGFIHKKEETYIQLKNFVNHLRFDKLNEEFSYSYTFNKIPSHTFTNLFNLHLCE